MARRLEPWFLMSASLAATAPARAEQPSDWKLAGAHVVVSVERAASALFWNGYVADSRFLPGKSWGLKPQGFDVSLLSSRAAMSSASLPRFAADYVTSYGLSVGGGIGFGYVRTPTGDAFHSGWPVRSVTALVVAPRIGYLAALSRRLALWPRAGVSRASYTSHVDAPAAGDSSEFWQLTLDPQLAIVIVPRVVFTTGALFETSIFEAADTPHQLAYGITAGFSAVF